MVQPTDILANEILTHQLDLLRLSAGERKKTLALLNRMQGDLTVMLNNGLTDYGKARVNRLLKEAEQVITDYYKRAGSAVDLNGIAAHEAEYTASTMTRIGLQASVPGTTAMKSIVSNVLIEGSFAAAWWKRQGESTAFNFAAQVRFGTQVKQGTMAGETIQQIVTRITGKAGQPGIMDISRRNATTLVHESVMAVANDAHMATYRANSDVVKGVKQLSTLDSHTTPVCMAYSGAEWDLDGKPINGTTLPWVNNEPGANTNGGTPRHWGCRSVEVPVTKTFRELGVNIDEMKFKTRASELGPVKADMTFDEFLQTKTVAQQDEMLGIGRAQLWRDGKITLQQLVSGDGRELTLEQLKSKAA